MKQKHVVVTGAAGGIGKITCQILLKNGYHVYALDKRPIIRSGDAASLIVPFEVDITDQQRIAGVVDQIREHTGYLDGLVNIAGIFDQFPLAEADDQRFMQLIQSNMLGHQMLTRALFPLLREGKGRIINLSSEMVLAAMPLQAYGFSKRLLEVWSDQLRLELGLLGMKVIKIRPGGHSTPFISRSMEVLSEVEGHSVYRQIQEKAKSTGLAMLRKVRHDPADIARVIVKALETSSPAKVYHVNVSLMFRLLSWIPAGWRDYFLTTIMRGWMKKKAL